MTKEEIINLIDNYFKGRTDIHYCEVRFEDLKLIKEFINESC